LTMLGAIRLINEVRVLFVGIRVRRNKIQDCSDSIFAILGCKYSDCEIVLEDVCKFATEFSSDFEDKTYLTDYDLNYSNNNLNYVNSQDSNILNYNNDNQLLNNHDLQSDHNQIYINNDQQSSRHNLDLKLDQELGDSDYNDNSLENIYIT
ncbi:694_t:CDS:2, partial [Racocetra fulgida]